MKLLVTQSCPTLRNPMDCTLPGSSVHGSLKQEYCSGLPFPSPMDFPDPGVETRSPALQADSLLWEPFEPLKTGFHTKLVAHPFGFHMTEGTTQKHVSSLFARTLLPNQTTVGYSPQQIS